MKKRAKKRKVGRPLGTTRTNRTERLNDRLIEGTVALLDKSAKSKGLDRAECLYALVGGSNVQAVPSEP